MRPESWVDSSRSWRAREPRLSSRTTCAELGQLASLPSGLERGHVDVVEL